jgi:anti-sigma regulatory factor (Ser/Thr protein kinase)
MHTTSLTVPATLESLQPISAFVLGGADAAGLSKSARYRLRLAVDELATNVITHGSAGAEVPGPIDVRLEMDDKTLTVILEDTGVLFDPRQVLPPAHLHLPAEEREPGGLGVYLALEGVDHFSYERVGGRNRNVLVMNRPPQERKQEEG